MPQVREIVLADFPFSDLTGSKVRPAVILGRCDMPDEFVLAFITTASVGRFQRFGLEIKDSHPEWAVIGLRSTSVVRLDKLVTLHSSIIAGKLGFLPDDLYDAARKKIRAVFRL